jgi:hypothetical protein
LVVVDRVLHAFEKLSNRLCFAENFPHAISFSTVKSEHTLYCLQRSKSTVDNHCGYNCLTLARFILK